MERAEQYPRTESQELKNEALAVYNELIKRPEISEALVLLEKLPRHLRYHGKAHTEDVIMETILFALSDGASPEVVEQQAVSAAWHDVGFIEQDTENEPIAVTLFRKSEAYKLLSEDKREEVMANIMDTQVIVKNGSPFLLKQQSEIGYALDGDVSNFGREDFFEKRAKVAEELGLNLEDPEVRKKFYKFALGLLRNHNWKTESARALRQAQKEKNLLRAEEEYSQL